MPTPLARRPRPPRDGCGPRGIWRAVCGRSASTRCVAECPPCATGALRLSLLTVDGMRPSPPGHVPGEAGAGYKPPDGTEARPFGLSPGRGLAPASARAFHARAFFQRDATGPANPPRLPGPSSSDYGPWSRSIHWPARPAHLAIQTPTCPVTPRPMPPGQQPTAPPAPDTATPRRT